MKNKILAMLMIAVIALTGAGCGQKSITIQPVKGITMTRNIS